VRTLATPCPLPRVSRFFQRLFFSLPSILRGIFRHSPPPALSTNLPSLTGSPLPPTSLSVVAAFTHAIAAILPHTTRFHTLCILVVHPPFGSARRSILGLLFRTPNPPTIFHFQVLSQISTGNRVQYVAFSVLTLLTPNPKVNLVKISSKCPNQRLVKISDRSLPPSSVRFSQLRMEFLKIYQSFLSFFPPSYKSNHLAVASSLAQLRMETTINVFGDELFSPTFSPLIIFR